MPTISVTPAVTAFPSMPSKLPTREADVAQVAIAKERFSEKILRKLSSFTHDDESKETKQNSRNDSSKDMVVVKTETNVRKLRRALSSFASRSNSADGTGKFSDGFDDEAASGTATEKEESRLKEKMNNVSVVPPATKRSLLRKLSSFTASLLSSNCSREDLDAIPNDNMSSVCKYASKSLDSVEQDNEAEMNREELLLRRQMYLGNPTGSFATEQEEKMYEEMYEQLRKRYSQMIIPPPLIKGKSDLKDYFKDSYREKIESGIKLEEEEKEKLEIEQLVRELEEEERQEIMERNERNGIDASVGIIIDTDLVAPEPSNNHVVTSDTNNELDLFVDEEMMQLLADKMEIVSKLACP